MREYVEFRIPETYAAEYLKTDQGVVLGAEHPATAVRKLAVLAGDPLYNRIGELQSEFRERRGKCFFYGWNIRYVYTDEEIHRAELFHLPTTATFEPPGEMCGTDYDDSTACPLCGAGRRQVSQLVLDLRKVPKRRPIARTIADEWIVSQDLAEKLVAAQFTGFELRQVRHKARYQEDPIRLSDYPSGRKLLRLGESAGSPHPSWQFYIWLNQHQQSELWQRAQNERRLAEEWRRVSVPRPMAPCYQLSVTSPPVRLVPPTITGIEPFEEDLAGKYRCPVGHTLGLNLLSEVWLDRATWDGSDFVQTEQCIGHRMGILSPSPLLLISSRVRQMLIDEHVKGPVIEVGHLVP